LILVAYLAYHSLPPGEPPLELVLGFDRALLDAHGSFQGVLVGPKADALFAVLTRPENLRFKERVAAEEDGSFKQLIPYAAFVKPTGEVFTYRRTKKVGEQRLAGKFALGVGGHINPVDGDPGGAAYLAAYRRELHEEIEIDSPGPVHHEVVGLLNDDSDKVGQVHFGVVHLVRLPRGADVRLREDTLSTGAFRSLRDIQESRSDFENWSQLVIDEVLAKLEL
jgi:predicted NUDIX family phosphoesterase